MFYNAMFYTILKAAFYIQDSALENVIQKLLS